MNYRGLISATCMAVVYTATALAQDGATGNLTESSSVRERANAAYQAKKYAECARLFKLTATASNNANDYYNAPNKSFEYFKTEKALAGYPKRPDVAVLDELASALVAKIRTVV